MYRVWILFFVSSPIENLFLRYNIVSDICGWVIENVKKS